jgi:Ca2+-binding EF-hand superfamily protein
MGTSFPDASGAVNYKVFSAKARDMIDELFTLDKLMLTADLITAGQVSLEKVPGAEITNLELFKLFKRYDKNLNGVLEINEYIDCLNDQDTGFTPQEIVTLGLMADVNGDNCIDYEEFMKHFSDMLRRIRFMRQVEEALERALRPKEEEGIVDPEAEKAAAEAVAEGE